MLETDGLMLKNHTKPTIYLEFPVHDKTDSQTTVPKLNLGILAFDRWQKIEGGLKWTKNNIGRSHSYVVDLYGQYQNEHG